MAVQLSTARAGLTYYPQDRAFLQADWPTRQRDGPRCDARYRVFRDLKGRGFYLTSAGKFGGDFLVYPGGPHSSVIKLQYCPYFTAFSAVLCIQQSLDHFLCALLNFHIQVMILIKQIEYSPFL